MSTLVQFLAAGVNGAGQGTAAFYLRGTATSALPFMWQDFEATNHPPSNVILLDQWGSAAVYVDVYCDVEVYTADNVLLRTYTVGTDAATVEVESPSFTGTDYDGAPANTAGEPVTLADVLDRWATSAGTTNWQVMVNGVPTDLDTALASVTPVFVNVKDPAYGALGDGVTDDTTAITAAFAAANTAGGGIVFFPAGTYMVTALAPSNVNLVLMGCGEGASIIRGRIAGATVFRFTDNTATGFKRVTGLGFSAAAAFQTMIDIEENQQVVIDHCRFTCTNISSAVIRRVFAVGESNVRVESCTFNDLFGLLAALMNIVGDDVTNFTVSSCKFVTTAGYTGDIITGINFNVTQCLFDASLVTSGTYHHIDAGSEVTAGKYVGVFTGNTFKDGGSSGYVFDLRDLVASSRFVEDGNSFIGFTPPEAENDAGHIYHTELYASGTFDANTVVTLGSRLGKTVCVAYVGTNLNPLLCQLVAENVYIDYDIASPPTSSINVSAPVTHLPPGCDFNVFVQNLDSLDNVHDCNLGGAINHIVDDLPVGVTANYGIKVFLEPASPPFFSLSSVVGIVAWFGMDQ